MSDLQGCKQQYMAGVDVMSFSGKELVEVR